MSTHNIGFYEEISKIIPSLSSNTHLISSSTIPLCSCFCRQPSDLLGQSVLETGRVAGPGYQGLIYMLAALGLVLCIFFHL